MSKLVSDYSTAEALKVVTHSGVFHADEVFALALIGLFVNHRLGITRVSHQTTDFSEADLVVDVGGKFDGKRYFDHHQYAQGDSAAKLIWNAIGLTKKYPKVTKLIDIVSDHDTGVKVAGVDSVIAMVSNMNMENIYGEEQDDAFGNAVNIIASVLRPLIVEQDMLNEVENILLKLKQDTVMVLPEYNRLWAYAINGDNFPEAEAVVWHDEDMDVYKIQTVPNSYGSYTRNGRMLQPSDKMTFVHKAGFLAVAPDKPTMLEYISDNLDVNVDL